MTFASYDIGGLMSNWRDHENAAPIARGSLSALRGHFWSLKPLASWLLKPKPLPPSEPFNACLDDEQLGTIRLTGALQKQGSDTIVLALHGLGGDISSHYIERTAIGAAALGLDCLRLNMRGADMLGEDIYHAGLTADVHAAVQSEALAHYRRILFVGFSLGGHLALRYATDPSRDRRLCAVAAVCPPLDLDRSATDIDSPLRWPYRRYVLASLREMLRAVASRRPLPLPLRDALRISHVRQWDERLVAPRFGFRSAAEYYRQMSAVSRLKQLHVPTLILLSRHDPMVLTRTVTATLAQLPEILRVRIVERAGHVGFPDDATLGQQGPLGMEAQLVSWMHAAAHL